MSFTALELYGLYEIYEIYEIYSFRALGLIMSVYIIAILGSAVRSSVSNQERLGVLAAPREVRSAFLIARLRSAGGFNL
jgi:hypothetical protein